MYLAGNLTHTVVLNEICFQQAGKLWLGLVLLPACTKLTDELGVYFLIGGWSALQEIGQPVNCTTLIGYEHLHLRRNRHLQSTFVVLRDLVAKENHSIALDKALLKACLKFMRGHWYRRVVAHKPGNHSVENNARIALGNKFQFAVAGFD